MMIFTRNDKTRKWLKVHIHKDWTFSIHMGSLDILIETLYLPLPLPPAVASSFSSASSPGRKISCPLPFRTQ